MALCLLIVPTLCVGMPLVTLRVTVSSADAERPWLHSHAERGNDRGSRIKSYLIFRRWAI
ncbi:hypothetical protein E1K68_22090 [Pseudomonas sp. B2021]|nr:hypothetical protein [Pseudomonas sp. B2021]PTT13433.1 hypothetical protein DBR14_08235 [Pseudomonas sp. HMWF034]PVV64989.1 hypothetical protein DD985_24990 [Pseudomonas sp. HMWF011]TKK14248.1 hypothetical protein PflCFBP13510_04320 [Pseudomonas fluorescens]TKK41339.1 hypothetical protein PflCFBP13517_10310 [Pseudomonas fluorescens]